MGPLGSALNLVLTPGKTVSFWFVGIESPNKTQKLTTGGKDISDPWAPAVGLRTRGLGCAWVMGSIYCLTPIPVPL